MKSEIWIQRIETGGFFCEKKTAEDAIVWCKQRYVLGEYRVVSVFVDRTECCNKIIQFGNDVKIIWEPKADSQESAEA